METKTRILHIDDNLHDRQLIIDALEKEHDGFEVIEADSREKFERYLSNEVFDIVLSDFNILGFDGLQVLQVVQEKDPDLPVIIVTGTGSEEIAIQAMKMGASDYVIKTANHIRGLAPAIKAVLKHKKVQQERKQALAALRASEELYRSIFENTSVAILLTTPEDNLLSANEFACSLFGYTDTEMRSIGLKGLVDNSDLHLTRLLEDRKKLGRAKRELTFIKKGGAKFQAEVSSAVFLDKECCERTSMVIRDLTEQRLAEEKLISAKEKAEESDRLKTAFLQNISHEIRTPMNAIQGFSGLIQDPLLPEAKREYFANVIMQSTDQLLSIINNIVSIATIEAGQGKINESEVNLNSALRLLYEQFIFKAEQHNILLQCTADLTVAEVFVITDETKLIEIFSNLLSNAIKFTEKGFVSFGYTIKENEVEFYVEDSGIGISPEMHTEIFKRFRQVETSISRKFGGSGLGLSISKAYVEMLGGRIWLDSQFGKGSVFYFTIPVKKPDNQSRNILFIQHS